MSRTYKRSAQTRQRMSEAKKRAWADPAVRQRMSEAAKRAWADPAVRQRRSEAAKRAWAQKNPDLARLTPEQLKTYKALRNKECTHEEALREVLRTNTKRAAE